MSTTIKPLGMEEPFKATSGVLGGSAPIPLGDSPPITSDTLWQFLSCLLFNNKDTVPLQSLSGRCQQLPTTEQVPTPALDQAFDTWLDRCTLEELNALRKFINGEFNHSNANQTPSSVSSGTLGMQRWINDVASLVPEHYISDFPDLSLSGTVRLMNVWLGAIEAACAKKQLEESARCQDRPGMVIAALNAVKGAMRSLGSFFDFSWTGTSIACSIENINVPSQSTPIAQICHWTGVLGDGASLVRHASNFVQMIYRLIKDVQFKMQLETAETQGHESLFKFLLKKVEANPEDKLGKIEKKTIDSKAKQLLAERLREKGLDYLTENFFKSQKEGENALSKTEVEVALKAFFTLIDKLVGKDQELWIKNILQEMVGVDQDRLIDLQERTKVLEWGPLELIGFQAEEKLRSQRKKDRFFRVTGKEQFENIEIDKIQKAARRGLLERLRSTDETVRESALNELDLLKKDIKVANTKTSLIHSALFVVSMVAVVTFALAFCTLNPVGLGIWIALGCLLPLILGGFDFYLLSQSSDQGPIGRHDKKFVALAMFLSLLPLIIGTGLTAGLMLPVLFMLPTFVASITGFGAFFYRYTQLVNIEEMRGNTQVTLNLFSEKSWEGDLLNGFKQLPKADRQAIQENYLSKMNAQQIKSPENLTTPQYLEITKKALKKTTHLFWERVRRGRSGQDQEVAFNLQSLLEKSIRENEVNFKQLELVFKNKVDLKNMFYRLLFYYGKREENPEFLKTSAQEVLKERSSPL